MRLQAAFLLLASCVPSSWAIFADEAFHIDYHYALLGPPQARTTFFHKPSSSSSASLLYTLSEKSILGAINPKDGSVVWRQNLSEYNEAAADVAGFLRAADGENTVVSAIADEVSSWGASDGKLAWTNRFETGAVVDLELVAAADEASSPRDSIVLLRDNNGLVRRLDGATGLPKWEHKDDR